MNKQILIVIFLIAIPLMMKSQTIENDLNVGFSFSVNKTEGKQSAISDNIIMPAIYSNLKKSKSGSLGINYKLNKIIRIGLKYEYTVFNNWSFSGSDFFKNSEIAHNIISVTTRYTLLKFKKTSFCFASQINPYIGNAYTKLSNEIIGFIPGENNKANPASNDLIWGVEGSVGIDFPLRQSFGIVADIGINKGWTKSVLFDEKSYLFVFSDIGIYFKLLKDRKFKYD
jgi:hypothetical protein